MPSLSSIGLCLGSTMVEIRPIPREHERIPAPLAEAADHASLSKARSARNVRYANQRWAVGAVASLRARRVVSGRRLVAGSKAYFVEHGVRPTPAELGRHQAVVHAMRSGGDSWAFGHTDGTEAAVTVSGGVRVSARRRRARLVSTMQDIEQPSPCTAPGVGTRYVRMSVPRHSDAI
jgi:hypothetical protein